MATAMLKADSARFGSDEVRARKRAAHFNLLANQRRFVLSVETEVKGSVEDLFEKYCADPIKEAIAAGVSYVDVDIPTYYRDAEPIPPEFWWQPGVRCKAILRHLQIYLQKEGFVFLEKEPYFNRHPRGAHPGCIGQHAIPLTISW